MIPCSAEVLGKGSRLCFSDRSDFVDFPWKVLVSLEAGQGRGGGWGGNMEGVGEGEKC